MKRLLSLLLAAALCFTLCACGKDKSNSSDSSLQENMAAALTDVDADSITGSKAIALIFDGKKDREGVYSTDLVPEELRTEDAGEVRYLIRCIEDREQVGYYSSGSAALRWTYFVEVVDLKQDQVLNSAVFTGSNPPAVLPEGSKNNVGERPDTAPILSWINSQVSRGTPIDCEKTQVCIYAQVPDGWGPVWLGYIDRYSPVEGGSRFTFEMEKQGDWYVLTVPGWVTDLSICNEPWERGSDGWHTTPDLGGPDAQMRDLWLQVQDLDGNMASSRTPITED